MQEYWIFFAIATAICNSVRSYKYRYFSLCLMDYAVLYRYCKNSTHFT